MRVLAPERVEVNRRFLTQRIREALGVRKRHLPQATSFRVVNAESDFLSGLIIDKYEDVLVLQISSLGMDQRKPLILEAVQALFQPKAVVERSDVASRKFEGLGEANGVLAGELQGPVQVQLNGLRFETDLLGWSQDRVVSRSAGQLPGCGGVGERRTGAGLFQLSRRVRTCTPHKAGPATCICWTRVRKPSPQPSATRLPMGWRTKCTFETVNVFDWLKAQTADGAT